MITMIKGAHFEMCCYMCVVAAVPVTVVITMIKGVHFVMCVITAIPVICHDHCDQRSTLCSVLLQQYLSLS